MDSMTKGVLILLAVLIIGGACATLIYFQDDIFGPQVTTITTTEVSTITPTTTIPADMSADELTYVQTLKSYDSSLVSWINNINSLLADPLITNQEWINGIATASGNVIGLYNAITQISVPSGPMSQFHSYYVNNVAKNYNTSIQYLTAAINEGKADGANMGYAKAYIAAGTAARTQFFNSLNDYINSYN
jgi:hypothetical protein